jgi:transposase
MDASEQLTLDIVSKVSTGQMARSQGQKILGVSERTLRRYLGEFATRGALFVKHGNYNRTAQNRSDPELKKQVLALVREKYFDFNVTHCWEKLTKEHSFSLSPDTLLRWCHEARLVKRAKRRSSRVRRRRERMAQAGMLLQMDGSPHCWFDGKPSCLIAAIDDATSSVPYGEFFASEDTISCMRVLQQIIERKGLFQVLYVDRAGIFGGPKRAHFSQVKRALGELGIQVLFANSPEAKGRIERLWNTLQDRLIPEMRLRNVRNYDTANEFLQEEFLPNEYAPKFEVAPENLVPAYRELPAGVDLREVFCLKEHRICKRDHTFSWNNQIYQIDSPLKQSIYKQLIELRTYQDLSWQAFFAGRPIAVRKVVQARKAQAQVIPISGLRAEIQGTKVRQDGHVLFGDRYYSVDESHCGSRVSIVEKEGEVRIYRDGAMIESHPKLTGNGSLCSTKREHLGPWRRALETDSAYRRAARRYGAHVEELVLLVLQRGQGFIDHSTIWGILGFDKSYAPYAMDQACKHALEIESPTYKAVKIFLKLQGNRWERKVAKAAAS